MANGGPLPTGAVDPIALLLSRLGPFVDPMARAQMLLGLGGGGPAPADAASAGGAPSAPPSPTAAPSNESFLQRMIGGLPAGFKIPYDPEALRRRKLTSRKVGGQEQPVIEEKSTVASVLMPLVSGFFSGLGARKQAIREEEESKRRDELTRIETEQLNLQKTQETRLNELQQLQIKGETFRQAMEKATAFDAYNEILNHLSPEKRSKIIRGGASPAQMRKMVEEGRFDDFDMARRQYGTLAEAQLQQKATAILQDPGFEGIRKAYAIGTPEDARSFIMNADSYLLAERLADAKASRELHQKQMQAIEKETPLDEAKAIATILGYRREVMSARSELLANRASSELLAEMQTRLADPKTPEDVRKDLKNQLMMAGLEGKPVDPKFWDPLIEDVDSQILDFDTLIKRIDPKFDMSAKLPGVIPTDKTADREAARKFIESLGYGVSGGAPLSPEQEAARQSATKVAPSLGGMMSAAKQRFPELEGLEALAYAPSRIAGTANYAAHLAGRYTGLSGLTNDPDFLTEYARVRTAAQRGEPQYKGLTDEQLFHIAADQYFLRRNPTLRPPEALGVGDPNTFRGPSQR